MEIFEEENSTNELIKGVGIDNLIAKRNFILEKFSNAIQLIQEASCIAVGEFIGFPTITIDENGVYGSLKYFKCKDNLNGLIDIVKKYVDREFWKRLFNESGLLDFFDQKSKGELDRSFYDKKGCPELTKENIVSIFADLYDRRGEMFESGVLNIFKNLSWNYKTNQPFKFGKKIIVNNMGELNCYNSLSFNISALDKLNDLQRAFCILDNKPVPNSENNMRSKLCMRSVSQWEEEYFHLKLYKKGTGHLTFKRDDLVEKMNKILHKHYPNALANDAR